MGFFTRPDLGALAQQWLEALSSRNLRFSTLANYTNSLIQITTYCYEAFELPEATRGATPSPLDELVRMRQQTEAEARKEALYTRRDLEFIEWDDAQRARERCEAAWQAAKRPEALSHRGTLDS